MDSAIASREPLTAPEVPTKDVVVPLEHLRTSVGGPNGISSGNLVRIAFEYVGERLLSSTQN